MTNEQEKMLEDWAAQAPKAELHIYDFCEAVDAMTDDAKTREGVRVLRSNFKMIMDARRKLDDLFFSLGPLVVAAE
jgi:hypothetical protein